MLGETGTRHELALVMPVHDEEECIGHVVAAWEETLRRLCIDFRMIVIDDGSEDRTPEILAQFADNDRIEIVHKENSGHGPTVLLGYHRAVALADWVFHCDSDDEMSPANFPELWENREAYDALFGTRSGRRESVGRCILSAGSRLTVRVLYGPGVRDVNTPYRLLRAKFLRRLIVKIPDDTFAPNVIISGALARHGARICNIPVPQESRRTGTGSIGGWRIWRIALLSFWQTIRCRPRL
jgi:glycosyltransferase involved in cell wall biosynthesis